jgi:hypothetical protein
MAGADPRSSGIELPPNEPSIIVQQIHAGLQGSKRSYEASCKLDKSLIKIYVEQLRQTNEELKQRKEELDKYRCWTIEENRIDDELARIEEKARNEDERRSLIDQGTRSKEEILNKRK